MTALRSGMHLQLPSGSVVILLRKVGTTCECTFTERSRLRGDAAFKTVWLETHARIVHTPRRIK